MEENLVKKSLYTFLDGRRLSIIVFSLFFSWQLAFPFQGQILYSLSYKFNLNPDKYIFTAIVSIFVGLFICGYLIKSISEAKIVMVISIIICFALSLFFYFPPSVLWIIAIVIMGFVSGASLASWGYFFKNFTVRNQRIKTAADGLIYSNVLMVLLNVITVKFSSTIGLTFAIIMLVFAFVFAIMLPKDINQKNIIQIKDVKVNVSIKKSLCFLCLFVVIITINSGLMYQVINPTYNDLGIVTVWYWCVPYIVALFIMRYLPPKFNVPYVLFLGIAMIGFSFIIFLGVSISIPNYLIVNTLMMGAFGIFDLFWWSIIGEMLDFHNNPAKIFGIGLSANVLGILLGGLIGKIFLSSDMSDINSTLLALSVICTTFVILPPLSRNLSFLLIDNVYLRKHYEINTIHKDENLGFTKFSILSDRESQVASLLLQRKTYKMIAEELFISENTVKYYVKNIYSKYSVQSRSQLIEIISVQKD